MRSDSRGLEYSANPRDNVLEVVHGRRGVRLPAASGLKASIEGFYPNFKRLVEEQAPPTNVIPLHPASSEQAQTGADTQQPAGDAGQLATVTPMPEAPAHPDQALLRRQLESIYRNQQDDNQQAA